MITPVDGHDRDAGVTLVVEQLRRPVAGGIGTYARELVRALVTTSEEVAQQIVLYASRHLGGADPLAEFGCALATSPLPGPVMTRMWELGLFGPPFKSSVVHALSLASPPTRDPLVVTIHDLAFRTHPETFTSHGRRWHERALLRATKHAAYIVVPSAQVNQQLLDAGLSLTQDRVRVINEGADHLGVADQDKTDELLGRLGVVGRFVLSVGTIEPRKNLGRLIAAFGEIRDDYDDPLVLVICGPNGWMANTDPTPGVIFAGHVAGPVLAGLYQRAAVVAYVPLEEGFGLPVAEAMFHGAVVLASPVPSATSGAYLVDPQDTQAIADGLSQTLTDEVLRAELRREALAAIAGRTWAKTAAEHLALWDEVRGR